MSACLGPAVHSAQSPPGIGGSNESGHEGGPSQRKLEVNVFLKVRTECGESQVIGQLEGGIGNTELVLDR